MRKGEVVGINKVMIEGTFETKWQVVIEYDEAPSHIKAGDLI